MHDETVALHGAYEPDGTRAVAVPIYQTVAHDFASAAHAGAVFDLEMAGFHYSRINNPTVDVLERRLAALERGAAGVALSSGASAVRYSLRNITEIGSNVVSTPQLYGATYTYFVHVLGHEGVEVRIAADDRAESIGPLIDSKTKAVFCESIGNPAGNVVDLEAVAEVAHGLGVPLIVDNTVATPLSLKPISHGADIVIHSLTKFVGGHGTTLGGMVIDGGTFPWAEHPERFPMLNEPEPAFHGIVYARDFPSAPTRSVAAQLGYATKEPLWRRSTRSCCCKGWRHLPSGWSVNRKMRALWPSTWSGTKEWDGSATLALRTIPTMTWPSGTSMTTSRLCSPSGRKAGTRPASVSSTPSSCSSAW